MFGSAIDRGQYMPCRVPHTVFPNFPSSITELSARLGQRSTAAWSRRLTKDDGIEEASVLEHVRIPCMVFAFSHRSRDGTGSEIPGLKSWSI